MELVDGKQLKQSQSFFEMKQKQEEVIQQILACNPQLRSFATSISEDDIRVRAYLKWEAAGKPSGQEDTFWTEAQKELMNE